MLLTSFFSYFFNFFIKPKIITIQKITYKYFTIINIKYSKVDNEIETMKNVKKFYEKNKKIIFISIGVIGFIILVVIIVNTIKDKKLDDEFNKL